MPRHENTKELFINTALKLFSERGYENVKISDIAKEVDCVPSALYKHYKNKQELYEAILAESRKRYDESIRRVEMLLQDTPERREQLAQLGQKELQVEAKDMLLIPLYNEQIAYFRRLMMVEQFNRNELAELYDKRYIEIQYAQYEYTFSQLMKMGKMKEVNPAVAAVQFVSPIVVFIGQCDRDPGKEKICLNLLEEHVKQFCHLYDIE